MSWIDRLAEKIVMVSPSGRVFDAKWRGSERSKDKKLGAFSPPDKKGTVFQDLGVAADKYPMTIFFDGENHDLIASLFFATCDEKGVWDVTHPVHGKLRLQLAVVVEKNEPITNGNNTQMDLEWFEPLEDDQLISSAKLAADIEAQIAELNAQAALQMEELADQNSTFSIQSLKNAYNQASAFITKGLETITELNADISRIMNNVQRAINSALTLPLIAISSISSQIQVLSQTPALALTNIQERLDTYESLGNTFFGIQPNEPSFAGRNEVAVKELVLTSVLTTMPLIVTTGDIQTRSEAILFAEFLADYFDRITAELDLTQELFEGSTIDVAYYSQSTSYNDMAKLISLAIQYLLRASFDLKIEKRFTLKKDRTPIEITISEYGGLGDNDENLDLFLSSNKLKNNDILLLPAGREVVVYV